MAMAMAMKKQELKPAPDSDREKLESLKSLNQMLLKETSERRRQVETLVQSKWCLETELTRTNSEKEGLESELTRLAESAAMLDIERTLVSAFFSGHLAQKLEEVNREMSEVQRAIHEKEGEIVRLNGDLGEMKGALGNQMEVSKRAFVERDEIKYELDLQMEVDRGLRSNLVDCEDEKIVIERALVELRADYDAVVVEKGDMEMRIESIDGEKDSLQRCLVESNELIEEMEERVRRALKEKERMEDEKITEVVRKREWENDVTRLNESVNGLQKEEVKLRSIVAELEKKCFVGEERWKEMVEKNKLSEKKMESLAADKTATDSDLREVLEQFAEEKRKFEAMSNENSVMMEAKSRLESEVSVLKNQMAELKGVVLELEESRSVEIEKIKCLESEVGDYRCNLDRLKIERGELTNCLNEEKENSERLREKIGALEDKIGERIKVCEKVKAEKASIFAEKMELEGLCGMLKKEITRLEDNVTEARKEFDVMKGKVEMMDLVLKDTAAAFCSSDNDLGIAGEEMKKTGRAYLVEHEMIKNAFKNKEMQLELLRSSVKDAHKKKSFWTVLSSATSLLAAASLAYVARGH